MEAELQDEAKLPESELPSAHTPPVGAVGGAGNGDEEEEVEQAMGDAEHSVEPEASPRRVKRRRTVVCDSSSSESKEDDLQDYGNSGTSQSAQTSPLAAPPLASLPPAASSRATRFGVPRIGAEPESDEDEPEYVSSYAYLFAFPLAFSLMFAFMLLLIFCTVL